MDQGSLFNFVPTMVEMYESPGPGEPDPKMREDLITRPRAGSILALVDLTRRVSDQLFPDRTDASMYLKIFEEMGEVIKTGGDPMEVADVLILWLDYASRKGIDVESVVTAKLEILLNRSWEQRDGVYYHVR